MLLILFVFFWTVLPVATGKDFTSSGAPIAFSHLCTPFQGRKLHKIVSKNLRDFSSFVPENAPEEKFSFPGGMTNRAIPVHPGLETGQW